MKKHYFITITAMLVVAIFLLSACSAAPREDFADSAPPAQSAAQPSYAYEAPADAAQDAIPGDGYYPAVPAPPESAMGEGTESYLHIEENSVKPTNEDQLVTFSLKVDTASYTNVARYIESHALPPTDAVKVEEMVNYFSYDTPLEEADSPFSIYTEIAPSPFSAGSYTAFVRVKARDIERQQLPASNLVFLIDVSGSMEDYDKLPLLKESFSLLTDNLDENDRVSIVTYADRAGVALSGAKGSDKTTILNTIYGLRAGGSTYGAQGIQTAYALAEENYIPGGNNRIILATDGDFNVGISNLSDLENFISTKRDSGIYLSTLGFGTGNLQDDIMETLSKHGDGNYSYINSVSTAQKVLVDELGSNLFTIADDVKAQMEFNPNNVKNYRLIGYENRQLENQDFDDDTKDAGEIGVGTDIVMLFELELYGSAGTSPDLKYVSGESAQTPRPQSTDDIYADELFEVRIRYKNPGQPQSQLILQPVTYGSVTTSPSTDFNFACSVAEFGLMLRGSQYYSGASIDDILSLARDNLGPDTGNYRRAHLVTLERYRDMAD